MCFGKYISRRSWVFFSKQHGIEPVWNFFLCTWKLAFYNFSQVLRTLRFYVFPCTVRLRFYGKNMKEQFSQISEKCVSILWPTNLKNIITACNFENTRYGLLFGQFKRGGATLSPIGNHDYQWGKALLSPLKLTE